MDRATYKAARRAVIVNGLKEITDGLYGLRMTLLEDDCLEDMLCDDEDVFLFTPEDDDE
jgi:hypothetical protein